MYMAGMVAALKLRSSVLHCVFWMCCIANSTLQHFNQHQQTKPERVNFDVFLFLVYTYID